MQALPTLETRVRAGVLRVRVMRAFGSAVWGGVAACAVVSVVAVLHWLSPSSVPAISLGIAVGLGAVLAVSAGIVAASRVVPPLPLLTRLDRRHGLADLLASAWELARAPDAQRSSFLDATLARAERAAGGVDVVESLPWSRPRGLGWFAIAAGLAVATSVGLRPQPTAAATITSVEPEHELERLLTPAQLEAFRARLGRIDRQAGGASSDALRAELERTLDELAAPADRLRVLRRLGELEQRALGIARGGRAGRSPSPAALGSAAPFTAEDSNAESDSADAERSGPAAAPAPAESGTPPQLAREDKAPEKPRVLAPPSSLDKPEAEPESRQAQPRAKRDDAEGEPEAADNPPTEPPSGQSSSPPASKQARPVAASRSKGDPNDDSPRGPDLERHRVPDNPSERQRGENLADAISELRDLMRRDESVHADLGDSGGNQPPRDRADPNRDSSRGNRPGAPNAAYASGGPPQVGREAGEPSKDDVPQLPAAGTRIAGVRSAGPVRSQVIYGAAQRGFAGSDYARVHAEYEDHAERELEREFVPPGYRGYVRRYFEAIAPRKAP